MVTMQARKLQTCQLGMPCWSVGQWPTSAGKRTSFHGGLSSPRSNAFRFVPRTPGCWHSWVQMFSVPLEKSRGCRWVSCTCFFLTAAVSAALALVMASAADKRFPECRPLWRPKWGCPEFHGSNVKTSGRRHGPARVVPSCWEHQLKSKRARWQQCCIYIGVLHGCHPSSSVVLCNGCTVAKRCKIGPRLLLITNKKSNTGFQMILKSMTLDDLERTIVCQLCGIVATR